MSFAEALFRHSITPLILCSILHKGAGMCTSRNGRVVQVLLLGGLLAGLAGCTSPATSPLSASAQAEALSHFSLGLLAEANGDSAAALAHFEAAAGLDPREERLYAPAVAVALKLEQPEKAEQLAQQRVQFHPGRAEPQLLLARVYALTEQPEKAETLFRRILADFPQHPEAAVFLARFHLSQEQRPEAMEVLRTALETQTDHAELLHLYGTLCIDSAREVGDTPRARAAVEEGIGFLQKALDLIPDDPARWQQLGYALLAVKRQTEALDAFRRARDYAPEDLMLARQLFDLLIQTGGYDEAMQSCDPLADATGTDAAFWLQYLAEKMPEEEHSRLCAHLEQRILEQPQAPVFYYAQLGSLYIGAGQNEKAETVLREATALYPDDPRLRTVLGYLLLQSERYSDAYQELSVVRRTSPESEWSANPFFLFNFLVSAQQSGHLSEAAELLAATYTSRPAVLNQYMQSLLTGTAPLSTDEAIDLLSAFRVLSPEAVEALYYLMVLQADQKRYDDALNAAQQFEALAQKNGDTNLLSGEFYYHYAALHERTGSLEAAEELFLRAISLGSDVIIASAQNYMAYMWAERGEKLDRGLKLIREALTFDPENGAFLDTLGWIYYMQGRYAEALTELQKASEQTGDDPTVWEHLGDVWLKLGNLEEASKHWKKALELAPDSEQILQRLKDVP